MSDQNKSDDLPFLDDLPYTPTQEEKRQQPGPSGAPDVARPAAAEPKPATAGPGPAQPESKPAPAQPSPAAAGPKPPRAEPKPRGAEPEPAQRQQAAPEPAQHPAPAVEPETKRAVIPPAILARRMQRYSIYLIVAAFLLVGVNYDALSLSAVLWFAAGLTAGFAILCAVAVVLLNAIAWNFDRLRDELRGGREVVDLRE